MRAQITRGESRPEQARRAGTLKNSVLVLRSGQREQQLPAEAHIEQPVRITASKHICSCQGHVNSTFLRNKLHLHVAWPAQTCRVLIRAERDPALIPQLFIEMELFAWQVL